MYQVQQKEKNTLLFLSYLYKKKSISISEAASDLKMTYPTIKRILDELLEDELVLKLLPTYSTIGRSPATFKINEELIFSIGVLIEVDKLSFILSNIYGEIVKEKVLSNVFLNQENFKNIFFREFDIFFNSLSDNYQNKVIGAGISFPGIVNNDTLLIKTGINLNINNISLVELRNKYDFEFYIENEANASVYSEKILGVGKAYSDFMLLSIASGIGMGVYLNSKIYRGINGMAGEVGHTCLIPNGKDCKCGNSGCWELYASETSLIKEGNHYFNEKFESLYALTSRLKGDEEIIKNYIFYLSIGIRNLLFSFDITNIIISGEITKYISHYEKDIQNILKNNIFLKNTNINIKFSQLHENSSIVGAALIPISKYFMIIED